MLRHLLVLLLAATQTQYALAASSADDPIEPEHRPCTIRSSSTQSFFDLNDIIRHRSDPSKKATSEPLTSHRARGWDYGANFTLNFCSPVIENLVNVSGVAKKDVPNVAAYYEREGIMYSIGSNNSELVLRGPRLVLNYTGGSPCPQYDPQHNASQHTRPDDPTGRRKSTVISLMCEKDPTKPKMSVAFVGTMDECVYSFEARTVAACPSINVETQALGPSSVFGLIAVVAILVYLLGGIAYQRTVLHQRGWRQLPNYALWASLVSFLTDLIIVFGSSVTRCLPGQRKSGGYNQLSPSTAAYGNRSRRSGSSDVDNRLMDEIDEEY